MNISKFKKIFSLENCIITILISVFIVIITTLFRFGMFTVPLADDYSMLMGSRWSWDENHSLIELILHSFKAAGSMYMIWSGEFPCMFLQTLCPGLGDYSTYFIGSWLIIICYMTSIFTFMYNICVKIFESSKKQWLIISLAISIFQIETTPALYDMFYWWNASVGNMLVFSYRLVILGFLMTHIRDVDEKKFKINWLIIFLGTFLAGWGEMIGGLVLLLVIILLFIFALIKKTNRFFYLYSTISYVLGFMVTILAPGNYVRANEMLGGEYGIFQVILQDFVWGYEYVNKWVTVLLIVFTALFVPFIAKIVKKSKINFRFPILISVLSFCLFSSQFSSIIYTGYYRAWNDINSYTQCLMYSIFILLWFGNVFYWLGWIMKHISFTQKISEVAYIFTLMVIIFIEIAETQSFSEFNTYKQMQLLNSNVCGEYKRDMLERESLLKSDNQDIVLPYIEMESMLDGHSTDSGITEDEKDWKNVAVSMYYRKNSVKVDKSIH